MVSPTGQLALSDSRLHTSKYLRLVCAAPQLVILSALFFCVSGWLIVWYLPNVYQSETRVNVDTEVIVEHYHKGDYLADMVRIALVTMANLEKVAIENDLLLNVRTDLDKIKVLEDLEANVSLISQRPLGGTGKYKQDIIISYRDIDADRSLSVLRSFLDVYFTNIHNYKEKGIARQLAYLDKQIETSRALLNDAEGEVTRLRTANPKYKYDQRKFDPSEGVVSHSEIELEFHTANGNYNRHRDRYLDYLKRHERRRTNVYEFADKSTDAVQVVEAPRILPGLAKPNRPLLFTLIFIGACALGIAAPIFRDLVGPSDSDA